MRIETGLHENAAKNGEAVKRLLTEVRRRSPAPASKKKNITSPPMGPEKRVESRPEETVRAAQDPVFADAGAPSPPVLSDTRHVSVTMGGQGSLKGGKDSLSVSLYDQSGTSMNSVPPGAGSGEQHLIRQIREAIERAKTYPELARKRRQEGTVLLEFSINSGGLPENIRIARSSGFSLLDAAAKETVIRAAPLPVVQGSIEVPITFILKREN